MNKQERMYHKLAQVHVTLYTLRGMLRAEGLDPWDPRDYELLEQLRLAMDAVAALKASVYDRYTTQQSK